MQLALAQYCFFIVIPSKAGGFAEEVAGKLGSLRCTAVCKTPVLAYDSSGFQGDPTATTWHLMTQSWRGTVACERRIPRTVLHAGNPCM